jgi:deazaflavin-dependent oxidoreductase (nitroreductase family)
MRPLLRLGLFPHAYALVETTGRRTGKVRVTPVGCARDGDTVWFVAEHGVRADFVRNLVARPEVRVRLGRRWRHGVATTLPDDDALARRRAIDRSNRLLGRVDGVIFRRNATDPLTVRIDLDGP